MLTTWPLDPPISVGLFAAGVLYVGADGRLRHGSGRSGIPRSRRRFFVTGLAVVFAALQSPIDAHAATSLSMHMVQHLLLTMAAAPLLVLGAPVTLALRAATAAHRRLLLRAIRSTPARLLSNPVVGWSLLFGVMWGSHFTGLYEAALRSNGMHAVEHASYLAAALLFWTPIVGVEPTPSRISHPARIFSLFLAMPAMAFLGLAIFSSGHVLYPTYARIEGVARALADQRIAGALMWTGGMFLIVPALAFVLFDWMRADDREARRVDEQLLRARMRREGHGETVGRAGS